jgi:hypothetical protein
LEPSTLKSLETHVHFVVIVDPEISSGTSVHDFPEAGVLLTIEVAEAVPSAPMIITICDALEYDEVFSVTVPRHVPENFRTGLLWSVGSDRLRGAFGSTERFGFGVGLSEVSRIGAGIRGAESKSVAVNTRIVSRFIARLSEKPRGHHS